MDSSVQRARRASRRRDPGDLDLLLKEIEKETIPDRLMQLALQLQAALADRSRREEEEGQPNGSRRPARRST